VFRTRPTNRIVNEFERAVEELERLIAGRAALPDCGPQDVRKFPRKK
jgi:hypothetical protein